MDPETDDDDSVLDPFIVPDSQIPEDDDENDGNKAMKEQEKVNDKHVMVLEKLDISVHPVEKDHEEGIDFCLIIDTPKIWHVMSFFFKQMVVAV